MKTHPVLNVIAYTRITGFNLEVCADEVMGKRQSKHHVLAFFSLSLFLSMGLNLHIDKLTLCLILFRLIVVGEQKKITI